MMFFFAAPYTFTWECSANVQGMPVLCTGVGV
jgi:hypothetical protein